MAAEGRKTRADALERGVSAAGGTGTEWEEEAVEQPLWSLNPLLRVLLHLERAVVVAVVSMRALLHRWDSPLNTFPQSQVQQNGRYLHQ